MEFLEIGNVFILLLQLVLKPLHLSRTFLALVPSHFVSDEVSGSNFSCFLLGHVVDGRLFTKNITVGEPIRLVVGFAAVVLAKME